MLVMKPSHTLYSLLTLTIVSGAFPLHAQQPSNGLAPEVPGLNLAGKLYRLEAKLPDLEKPYLSAAPEDKNDGLVVGEWKMASQIERPAISRILQDLPPWNLAEMRSLIPSRSVREIETDQSPRGFRSTGSKMSACRMNPRSLAWEASVAPSVSSP